MGSGQVKARGRGRPGHGRAHRPAKARDLARPRSSKAETQFLVTGQLLEVSMSLLPSVGKSWWTDSLRWIWSQMVPYCLLLPKLSLCPAAPWLCNSLVSPVAQEDAGEQGLGPSAQSWVMPGALRPCDTAPRVRVSENPAEPKVSTVNTQRRGGFTLLLTRSKSQAA